MFRKSLTIILAALLIQTLCVQSASAKSKEEERAQLTEKVRLGVLKLGVGRDARVEVTLQRRTKLAGYIREVNDDSFVVASVKTGAATTVAYADVTRVKGHNLSTGAKVGIGIGIGLGIALIAFLIVRSIYSR
jgi:hypothetical protein